MTSPVVISGIILCSFLFVAIIGILWAIQPIDDSPYVKERAHAASHGNRWKSIELTQAQCAKLGFLSGDPHDYYVYNTKVEQCGNVIRFKQSQSAWGTDPNKAWLGDGFKYAFL